MDGACSDHVWHGQAPFRPLTNVSPINVSTDNDQLSDLVQIQAIQNKTRNALEEYIRLNHPESSSRFGQLLIKLTSLGAVEPHIIEHVFFNKLIGGASINNLVDDILRANTLMSHAKSSAVWTGRGCCISYFCYSWSQFNNALKHLLRIDTNYKRPNLNYTQTTRILLYSR